MIETHRLNFASFPIIGYSLTSDTVPQTQLWEMATYEIKPRLNRLDGVATVVVQGGQEPEFHITPDPAKLLAANINGGRHSRRGATHEPDRFARIAAAEPSALSRLGRWPSAASRHRSGRSSIKTTQTGVPVRVGDVAAVGPGVKPVYTIVTANGKPAVLLSINRQPDSNTVAVADEVHAEVERIRQSLPPGVRLEPFYDQSQIVTESIKSVRDAILIGLVLASVIMCCSCATGARRRWRGW